MKIVGATTMLVENNPKKLVVRENSALKNSTINIGSDKIAQAAIDFAGTSFQEQTSFLENISTQLLNSVDTSAERALTNIEATRDFTQGVLDKSAETQDDRLIKTLMIIGGMGLAATFILNGGIK